MATDYGTDVQALDDLPDPEVLTSGDLNVAYAIARRWLTGALSDSGDPTPYESIDVRDWLGKRLSQGDLDELRTQAVRVASQDERVLSIDVTVGFGAGVLSLTGQGHGTDGPFSLVLTVDGVTATLLRGGV